VKPRISVCIPSYNHERFVDTALRSVLSQDVDGLEVVVVDDCSSDRSAERIREIGDSRVRLLVNERNMGTGATANRALAESSGEYVTFIGSDDEMYPDALARKAAVLDADAQIGLVYSDAAIIDADSRRLGTYWASEGYAPLRGRLSLPMVASAGFFIPAITALIRRRCLDETGPLDESLRHAHDGELWMRIAARAPIDFVDAPLVGWRMHGRNLHQSVDPASYTERSMVTARILAENPWAAPRWIHGALIANPLLQAVELAFRRDPREARAFLREAFRVCPYHPLLPLLYTNTFLDVPALWNLGIFKRALLKLLNPRRKAA
jgi:glycosyltransferase involved in cell wall biosynthesis